jgi:UDP-N-acetylglucosamine--N-acetylmuramyl-(pentapeptide) pyrophosphoryl-undecaprenol N-acetylglucosamine transferase
MIEQPHIIISGGGTGGHIFPAIAIADALKREIPDCKILFVGAKGRMEMEKVPAAGYEIEGLPVAGFQRRITLKNISFFFKLAASMWQSWRIIHRFKPLVAVGVGGYASGPVLRAASAKGVPILIQEQNSYPGVTNKILARKAAAICVAYPDMDRFFPKDKIVFTGNPVRSILSSNLEKNEGYKYFGLNSSFSTILVVGGSLGARSINQGLLCRIEQLKGLPVQVLWQTGKYYFDDIETAMVEKELENVKTMAFVKRMDLAYAIADVVVSRAGASTISELALLGKAAVLVPSSNVSEDHQTKNAMALVNVNAAVLVKDDSTANLLPEALQILNNDSLRVELEKNVRVLARPAADRDIAMEVIKIIDKN